jgi:hypothetical protein
MPIQGYTVYIVSEQVYIKISINFAIIPFNFIITSHKQ